MSDSEQLALGDFADETEYESPTFDATMGREDAITACRASLDYLAAFILTELFSYGYPPILKAMWNLICDSALQARGKYRYALGIPRGFSKTIVLKLYVVWCILFSDRKFVLIVCATEGHAQNFISDVADMLDHPNIKLIFGDWRAAMSKDTQGLIKFSFRGRNIILAGLGAGGSPRGLNIKFVRPDLVIMDDIQKKEEASNPELSNELYNWMLGTLMMACHPQICTFIYVGNMYPYEGCILRKLKHSKEWISLITGAIAADGDSIWPEHRDLADLMNELAMLTEAGKPEIFFSEVMNDEEAGTVSGIDVSKIPDCPPHLDLGTAQGGFVIIDPSLGKKKSDDVAIGAFLVFDGIPVLRELQHGKFNPGQTIQHATFMAVKYHMQLIVAEAVGYQESLVFWFNQVYAQLGIQGLKVATVTPEGMQKNARIRDSLKLMLQGKLMLHKDTRAAVIYQITQWNPLKTNNKDDILDVCAYAQKVITMYAADISLMIVDGYAEPDLPPASFSDDLQLAF